METVFPQNTLVVGDVVPTYEDLYLTPVGTRLQEGPNGRARWTKYSATFWRDSNGYELPGYQFSLGALRIHSYPPEHAPAPPVPLTLRRYMWFYRQVALSSGERNGIDRHTVIDALNQMGCVDDRFPFGRGVPVESEYDAGRLPTGTIGFRYGGPDLGSVLYEKDRRGTWQQVLGEARVHEHVRRLLLRVESVPGVTSVPDWLLHTPREDEERRIAEFKRMAWVTGLKFKRAQQWCGTYEACVARAGVTAASARIPVTVNGMYTEGQTLAPEQVATLPEGSILRWRHPDSPLTRVHWYVRDDTMENVARTRHVCGYQDDSVDRTRNYLQRMEFLRAPDPELEAGLEIDWARVSLLLPHGTVIRSGDGPDMWVRARDGRWVVADRAHYLGLGDVPLRGQYDTHAFGAPDVLRLVSFGPVR